MSRHRSPDPPPRWSQAQIAVACSIAAADRENRKLGEGNRDE